MKYQKAKEHIDSFIQPDEMFHGWFIGQYYNLALIFIIGPLAWLTLRFYYFAVTDKGIHIHRLGLSDQFEYSDFFPYSSITSLSFKKGFLQKSVRFSFDTGRSLRVQAITKGVASVPKLTDEILKILESNIGG